jgi:hypothetical protein
MPSCAPVFRPVHYVAKNSAIQYRIDRCGKNPGWSRVALLRSADSRPLVNDPMTLDLTEESASLAALLRRVISDDRYPLSPRIRTLRGILDKIEPPPALAPLPPPPKHYEPPRAKRRTRPADDARQRRRGARAAHRMVQGVRAFRSSPTLPRWLGDMAPRRPFRIGVSGSSAPRAAAATSTWW